MSNVELLPMGLKHVEAVVSLSRLCFSHPWSEDAFKEELSNTLALYTVAAIDGKVIGYGGLWTILDEGHITNIAVHPEFQGQGIASLILHNLEVSCKEKGILSLTLEVRASNYKAQGLYSKFGFVIQGLRKNYYEDPVEDALILWKNPI